MLLLSRLTLHSPLTGILKGCSVPLTGTTLSLCLLLSPLMQVTDNQGTGVAQN